MKFKEDRCSDFVVMTRRVPVAPWRHEPAVLCKNCKRVMPVRRLGHPPVCDPYRANAAGYILFGLIYFALAAVLFIVASLLIYQRVRW